MDEPTIGIDVGSKAEIRAHHRRVAAEGVGVLLITTELDELVDACATACWSCSAARSIGRTGGRGDRAGGASCTPRPAGEDGGLSMTTLPPPKRSRPRRPRELLRGQALLQPDPGAGVLLVLIVVMQIVNDRFLCRSTSAICWARWR